jgi:hypothetical protein
MSHHKRPPNIVRIFIACSPSYHNRRAIMEALGSIFIDTIEQQREYYYFDCPAMAEIFDDGVFNSAVFHLLVPADAARDTKNLQFTYVVAGGDDAFVAKTVSELGASDALLVRLA